jgi:protein-L-isoaspartate(D-aspartate) O-methyltransferase
MDFEHARHLMIEQQIRPWEVLDPEVLGLLSSVKREDFVPAAYRGLAFVDMEIPLGHGEAMWSPKLEARALQALALKAGDRVLEIGSGSGYLTALLSRAAGSVTSVEIHADLHQHALQTLAAHGVTNARLEVGDGARGWPGDGPYDAIMVTGSLHLPPEEMLAQLAPGGRLFAVIGEPPAMQARLYTLVEPGFAHHSVLFETVVKPLVNAPEPARFVF